MCQENSQQLICRICGKTSKNVLIKNKNFGQKLNFWSKVRWKKRSFSRQILNSIFRTIFAIQFLVRPYLKRIWKPVRLEPASKLELNATRQINRDLRQTNRPKSLQPIKLLQPYAHENFYNNNLVNNTVDTYKSLRILWSVTIHQIISFHHRYVLLSSRFSKSLRFIKLLRFIKSLRFSKSLRFIKSLRFLSNRYVFNQIVTVFIKSLRFFQMVTFFIKSLRF